MTTNNSFPKYDINGWVLYDTSPIEHNAAKLMVKHLKDSGRYPDAKVSGYVKDFDGTLYAYIRVKRNRELSEYFTVGADGVI